MGASSSGRPRGQIPILLVDLAEEPHRGYHATKRAIDLAGSVLALVIVAPVLLIAVLLQLSISGRPVFVAQRRTGLGGREFLSWKLRTTQSVPAVSGDVQDADITDGPALTQPEQHRLTRLGRVIRLLGIDELPQLWSVLRGDLSLVGPHPLAMTAHPMGAAQLRRLSVKPGLISEWKLHRRSRRSFEVWMAMDLEYLDRRSLGYDVWLLLRAPVLLGRHMAARR